jgi:Sulfotransferase domain
VLTRSRAGLLPDFLYLGPGKAGSTWLYEALTRHPDVYLSTAKDLYFFSRYYDRGLGWYEKQFRRAQPSHRVIGEISPDYLACAEAPQRIRSCLGADVHLMVTLREPAARAFSSYLYLRKHGLAAASFVQTIAERSDLLEDGRYATQLRRYLRCFGRRALHVSVFDDLRADPQAFCNGVTDWLGISRQVLGPELLAARLPASQARWLPLAWVTKHGSEWARRHDGAELVGRVKRSALAQRVLYKPLGDDRPVMSPQDSAFIREQLESEIAGVESDFGIPLRELWGWH